MIDLPGLFRTSMRTLKTLIQSGSMKVKKDREDDGPASNGHRQAPAPVFRRAGCGTSDRHRIWFNADPCGMICATFVWLIVLYSDTVLMVRPARRVPCCVMLQLPVPASIMLPTSSSPLIDSSAPCGLTLGCHASVLLADANSVAVDGIQRLRRVSYRFIQFSHLSGSGFAHERWASLRITSYLHTLSLFGDCSDVEQPGCGAT
jgi:hypothetical protein